MAVVHTVAFKVTIHFITEKIKFESFGCSKESLSCKDFADVKEVGFLSNSSNASMEFEYKGPTITVPRVRSRIEGDPCTIKL
jgi:hypothetical protein